MNPENGPARNGDMLKIGCFPDSRHCFASGNSFDWKTVSTKEFILNRVKGWNLEEYRIPWILSRKEFQNERAAKWCQWLFGLDNVPLSQPTIDGQSRKRGPIQKKLKFEWPIDLQERTVTGQQPPLKGRKGSSLSAPN
ncbi:hypothetical protein DdX_16557 [Ditylenchus destructor]|uniref:Uncharacterized protein n=1 Tax=Ditylenchus destructor TaxID=166010 RepID=A0AAD4MNP5_9BILA|nr:hypothetical protein DdX_16557 [Ditylenchus destructor]